jgi:L-lactate utilization protein LutB
MPAPPQSPEIDTSQKSPSLLLLKTTCVSVCPFRPPWFDGCDENLRKKKKVSGRKKRKKGKKRCQVYTLDKRKDE